MNENLRLDAVAIAHTLLQRRVLDVRPGFHDAEELKQDLAAHVLGALKYYRPEKGSLGTFVGMTFDQWWKTSIKNRRTRQGAEESRWEMPDAPHRAPADVHTLSPRAEAILSRLPEHQRETAYLHIALGSPLTAVAELTGTNYHATASRARRARTRLKAMAPA